MHNVILIGWDGVQRNHLKETLRRNELPHLARLSEEGAIMAIDVTTGKTDTKAGWSEILTGYSPKKTGVYSNDFYGPIPEGYSIIERLEAHLGQDNIVTGFLAGKRNNLGARGPHLFTDKGEGPEAARPLKKIEPWEDERDSWLWRAGEPNFYIRQHADVFENDLGPGGKVGARALEYLDKYKDERFFFFVHFWEPDHPGHRYGENSPHYTQGIISDDEWLGNIVAKLRVLNLYDKTRIYVTSDHGFNEGQWAHPRAPHVFLATNDPLVGKKGDRKDIAPTILWRMGMALEHIRPRLDGEPLVKTGGDIW